MYDIFFQQTFYLTLITITSFCIISGFILSYASIKLKVEVISAVEQIDNLLPQTQCGQCSYSGCKPYAQAIVEGDVINKCPPGGQTTINSLANLLGIEAVNLDMSYGIPKERKTVAFIREDECIGCTKCIQACPVDAILGAAKQMHTVIEKECTGCDLCIDPCPVDCIDILTLEESLLDWSWDQPLSIKSADIAKKRFEYQKERRNNEADQKKLLQIASSNFESKDDKFVQAESIIQEAIKQAAEKKSSPEVGYARFLRQVARSKDQLLNANKKLKKLKKLEFSSNDDKYKQAIAAVEDARIRLAAIESSNPRKTKPTDRSEKNEETQKKNKTGV
ncbi:MAG: electron transport complex subunit RsxB [Porticoccus sp.]|jgi:electron transport complex protein RnfB|nr:electron transport complex subunit RsxB [Porticoccus sp.]|tara:strand:- start:1427 stop:2431 length:1005 start_codon:yes stop_codon:yes gene_type:complete